MANPILKQPHFHDEQAAFAVLESILWPNGPTCPHCGATDRLGKLENQRSKASKKNPEGKLIHGLWKCYHCREKFTVRLGSIFEDSHLELHLWFQAAFLMCSSKKGISTNQLHRTLGVTLKTAWFVGMRLREAMAPADDASQLGGPDMIVEADETEIVPSTKSRRTREANKPRQKFIALIERGGRVRSRVLTGAEGPMAQEVRKILKRNMDRKSILHTDGHVAYRAPFMAAKHEAVDHCKQMARTADDGTRVHCNSAEGYFSIFKRGLVGTYQHMSEKHLPRYLAEFDFRMSNRVRLGVDDEARTVKALQGAAGKRLTYRWPN